MKHLPISLLMALKLVKNICSLPSGKKSGKGHCFHKGRGACRQANFIWFGLVWGFRTQGWRRGGGALI